MLRLGVDATPLGARATGAGRFLMNLLAALPEADPEIVPIAFVTRPGRELLRARAPQSELHEVSGRRGVGWELHGVSEAAAAARADLLFTVRELVPRGRVPVAVHVFEPPAYRLRTFGAPRPAEARRYAKDVFLHAMLRRSLARAAAVTAGSATTADWLRRRARVEAQVVLPGIEPSFLDDEPAAAAEPPYVLHLSSRDARDNTELVLRALASPRLRGVRLVLAGTPGGRVRRRAADLGVEIELTGWISDERLRELYRGALALAHPTKYEGFAGYPALEALALGTPVVALDVPGAREALAGRALLVPREDPALLAEAIAGLRDTPGRRTELAQRGRELARSLTWQAAATAFAGVFRRALEQDR